MSQCRADRCQEWGEPTIDESPWRKTGQSPILPMWIEQVRWCADGKSTQHLSLAAPRMATGGVHPNGKVCDQADTHTGLLCFLLCGRQGPIREPLQKTMEPHVVFVRSRKYRHRCASRIAQIKRPLAPIPRAARRLHSMQGLEHGVLRQKITAVGAKLCEISM